MADFTVATRGNSGGYMWAGSQTFGDKKFRRWVELYGASDEKKNEFALGFRQRLWGLKRWFVRSRIRLVLVHANFNCFESL